jgi:hypothetical protein
MNAAISFVCALQNDADFFVAALYDDTPNPPSLLESQQVPKTGGSYTSPFQVTFVTNLVQNKTYRVILWESPDNTPTGVSRVSGDFTPSLNSITLRGTLRLVGGSSAGMAIGASGYVDPTNSLAGWNYDLELFGSGTMGLGVDYTIDPVTGNWTLINGMTITAGQVWYVHFQPQVSQAAQPPVSAITSGQIIVANTTFTSAYKNQALYIQGAGSSITCPLPALSSMSDYDYLILYCSGGNYTNAIFPTQGTDKIQYGPNLLTQLVLGQGETLKLFRANGVYNVDGPLPGVDNVGQIIDSVAILPNSIQGKGQLLDRTQYARLYAWANAAGVMTSETNWNTAVAGNYPYKGYYTQGIPGANNFRVPDYTAYGFTRAVDGVIRVPCSFQAQLVGTHSHASHGGGAIVGGGGPYYLNTSGGDHSYSQGGGDAFGRGRAVDTLMRTSDGTDDPQGRVGAENRSSNTGVLRLIRI